ncbi:prepilin-type N-terminal cleavage/methylation domain-containing protein [Ectothiorhodospiraceae bacterium BW-2]|nr:prepilin-type N-terminal cleavage/methylation domain-containing protein [Ectothiorhodospiraceae bacterium BW-2]
MALRNGFTLLELLIVLVLLGLISGLAIPRLNSLYESGVARYELEEIMQQIAGLGVKAYQQQQTIALGIDNDMLPFQLPDAWQITTENPVIYQQNGVCRGGTVALNKQNRHYRLALNPPYCRPVLQ